MFTKKKKYKVRLTLSFEFVTEVEAKDNNYAEGYALDKAMDYLDVTLSNSRKFNEFWEYDVKHKVDSIEEIDNKSSGKYLGAELNI